jgi:hypothetical protein
MYKKNAQFCNKEKHEVSCRNSGIRSIYSNFFISKEKNGVITVLLRNTAPYTHEFQYAANQLTLDIRMRNKVTFSYIDLCTYQRSVR